MTDDEVEVSALAINVTVPESLRWRDVRRGEEFELTTLNVRMLPDGHLAVKAYGRPTAGGRGAYVAFRVPDDDPELEVRSQVTRAGLHPTPVIDRNYFHSVYFREPGGVLFELATMGPGVPYVIGAKFAHPERPVVALVGDGAMQMNGMAELITVHRYWKEWSDPRFVVAVIHNDDLNQVTWEMRAMEGAPKFAESQSLPDVSYASFAASLGFEAIEVREADQLATAVRASAPEHAAGALPARRAFVRTDHGVQGGRRQIPVAAFAVRAELQHGRSRPANRRACRQACAPWRPAGGAFRHGLGPAH